MIDPRLSWFAIGATCSAVLFGWPWHPRFSRFSRRRPYSSAAIAFLDIADAEDAAKVRSKIVNPLVWEDPSEPMTVEEWARRGWRPHPTGRIVDAYGRTVGYIPRSQGDTPNPPPEVP